MKADIIIYNIYQNIKIIYKTDVMANHQSCRSINLFGRIDKNPFFNFGELSFDENLSEFSYQSISM
jgi:hypothetical protein